MEKPIKLVVRGDKEFSVTFEDSETMRTTMDFKSLREAFHNGVIFFIEKIHDGRKNPFFYNIEFTDYRFDKEFCLRVADHWTYIRFKSAIMDCLYRDGIYDE